MESKRLEFRIQNESPDSRPECLNCTRAAVSTVSHTSVVAVLPKCEIAE